MFSRLSSRAHSIIRFSRLPILCGVLPAGPHSLARSGKRLTAPRRAVASALLAWGLLAWALLTGPVSVSAQQAGQKTTDAAPAIAQTGGQGDAQAGGKANGANASKPGTEAAKSGTEAAKSGTETAKTGGEAAKTGVESAKSGGENGTRDVPTLESVNSSVLKPLEDREIKVQGIVGDYHQTTNRYEFHMNDGSHIEVIGDYPATAHTTYALNARVVRKGADYALSEIRKERVEGGASGGTGAKIDPLLLAGGLLLAAAVVIFLVMTARSKAAQQKQIGEQQIEQERRKAEAARQEAERLRAAAGRPGATGGPGGTVVTGAATPASNGAKAAAPARTIVSIGGVEIIAGPHMGQKFPLQQGETPIGRALGTSDGIVLDRDGEVSSRHGSLVVTIDGRVLYRDESTNGSILDGKTIHHLQAEAHSGSQLEIGASTLRVTLRAPSSQPDPAPFPNAAQGYAPAPAAFPLASPSAQAGVHSASEAASAPSYTAPSYPAPANSAPSYSAPASATPSCAAPAAPSRSAATIAVEAPLLHTRTPAPATQSTLGAELEVIAGPETGQRFAITRAVTGLGREDQDILLGEESISRKHATLAYRDGKFLLTDQNSTHGTKVNGESIGAEARELVNGDRVTPGTGRTELLFHRV